MRVSAWHVYIIAIFVAVGIASGDILRSSSQYEETYPPDNSGGGTSGGNGQEHTTTANASGDEPYTWGYGEGSDFIYTTEGATCTWRYDGYVYADADAWIWYDEWAEAYGYGDISASGPTSDGLSGRASINEPGYGSPEWMYVPAQFPDQGQRYTIHDDDTDFFSANEGISCSHTSVAQAGVPQGGYSYCRAHADAWARGLMAQ